MFNKIMSLFNSGTINQSNNHFYNANVETQVKQIKRTFNEGRISLAFSDLEEAKAENSSNRLAIYNFLILKAQMYLVLKNFEKIKELISYLEDKCRSSLDISFYEIQATIHSFDNDIEKFNNVIEKLKIEFSVEHLNVKYTELIFLLNINSLDKAKEKYEEYKLNRSSFQDKRIDFIGGIIYSQLFFKTLTEDYANISREIFLEYIKENEVSYFDKLDIYKTFSFFHTLLVFNSSVVNEEYKEEINITLSLLNKVKNDLKYFGNSTRIDLENSLLHCLWLNEDKDEFFNKYVTYNESELNLVNFLIYNVLSKDIDEIDYEKVETYIQEKEEALVPYLNFLIRKENSSQIINFVNQHKNYLENEIIVSIYTEAYILLNKELDADIVSLVNKKKDSSLISFLTYLELLQYKDEKIDKEMFDVLEEYMQSPITHNISILKALKIFIDNNQFKSFFELASKYKENNQLIKECLKLIYENKNIYLIDIEKFILNIEEKNHLNIIGNIYQKYGLLSKAYEYYKKMWEPKVEFINFTCGILNNCSIVYFHKNNGARIDEAQDEVYIKFLESHIDMLDIEQLLILSSFKIVVQKSYSDGFSYINKRLLSMDVTKLEQKLKEHLSRLYFYTITYEKDKKVSIDSNLIIKENNSFHLSANKYQKINSLYNIQIISDTNFRLLLQNNNIEKLSCFHVICNYFLHSMESNSFVSKKASSTEESIKEIEKIIHSQREHNKEKIDAYSNGKIISFYNLSNSNYDNFFELIPILYENVSINFDAGYSNLTFESVKKILTLSSIIFIDHLGKLDYVLSRKDIYIQQTTIDFLLNFIDRLNNEDEIMTLHSDGNKMFSNIKLKEDIQKNKDYLVYLATKVTEHQRIADDRESILQIAESESLLVPQIGRQEYKAIAYAYENNYQVITEDRIISYMFERLNFNMNMVSNSSFLLTSDLGENEPEKLGEYYSKLHEKKYKYILNKAFTIELLKKWIFKTPELLLTKGYEGKLFKSVVSICYSYGWMNEIDKYYSDNYEFKIGMSNIPKKDFVSKNIEYLRELSNYFNEKDFASNAVESFKIAQEEALAKKQKIFVSEDDGFIYEKTSSTEKKFIKKTNKKIKVDTSKTVDL